MAAPNVTQIHENGRRVAEILADMKNEFVEFVQTRITMFRAELNEKWEITRKAIPLAVAATLFLATSFLLLTAALVGLCMAAFPNSVLRWFFACLIVGVVWAIIGGCAAYFAVRPFMKNTMVPRRTLEVLKGDKVWIVEEVNRV